jgi:hypothetical protein
MGTGRPTRGHRRPPGAPRSLPPCEANLRYLRRSPPVRPGRHRPIPRARRVAQPRHHRDLRARDRRRLPRGNAMRPSPSTRSSAKNSWKRRKSSRKAISMLPRCCVPIRSMLPRCCVPTPRGPIRKRRPSWHRRSERAARRAPLRCPRLRCVRRLLPPRRSPRLRSQRCLREPPGCRLTRLRRPARLPRPPPVQGVSCTRRSTGNLPRRRIS